MVIDFHIHAFPDALASKAIPALSHCAGGITPAYSGAVSGLKQALRQNGADKGVVLNIATNPHQQHKVNDFAIQCVGDDMLIPFGSIHPDSPDAEEELDRLWEAGVRGIKLHPDYQGFFVDDARMLPLYEKIAKKGFVTVFHAGVDIGYPHPVHCTPLALARVLDVFGDAPVVAAHFGGYMLWESVMNALCGTKIYLDTAFSYGRMPPQLAKEIIAAHGEEHILFGSDMPWSATADELRFLHALDLPAQAMQKILYQNAETLLTASD